MLEKSAHLWERHRWWHLTSKEFQSCLHQHPHTEQSHLINPGIVPLPGITQQLLSCLNFFLSSHSRPSLTSDQSTLLGWLPAKPHHKHSMCCQNCRPTNAQDWILCSVKLPILTVLWPLLVSQLHVLSTCHGRGQGSPP